MTTVGRRVTPSSRWSTAKVEIDFGTGWVAVTESVAGLVSASPASAARSTGSTRLDARRHAPQRRPGLLAAAPARTADRPATCRSGYTGRAPAPASRSCTSPDGSTGGSRRPSPSRHCAGKVASSIVTVKARRRLRAAGSRQPASAPPRPAPARAPGPRVARILDAADWDADAALHRRRRGRPRRDRPDQHRPSTSCTPSPCPRAASSSSTAPASATFFDRASITASLDPVVRFGNDGGDGSVTYGVVDIADTDEAVVDTVTCARTGGTAYTAVDSGGASPSTGQQLFVRTDLPLEDDPQAEALAAVLLSRAVNASFVVGPIEIQPITGRPGTRGRPPSASASPTPCRSPTPTIDTGGGFTAPRPHRRHHRERSPRQVDRHLHRVRARRARLSYEVIGPPYDLTASTSWTSIAVVVDQPRARLRRPLRLASTANPWVEIPGDADESSPGGLDPSTSHTFDPQAARASSNTGRREPRRPAPPIAHRPRPGRRRRRLRARPGRVRASGAGTCTTLDATLGVTVPSSGTFSAMVGSYWRPTYRYVALTWYRIVWQKLVRLPEGPGGRRHRLRLAGAGRLGRPVRVRHPADPDPGVRPRGVRPHPVHPGRRHQLPDGRARALPVERGLGPLEDGHRRAVRRWASIPPRSPPATSPTRRRSASRRPSSSRRLSRSACGATSTGARRHLPAHPDRRCRRDPRRHPRRRRRWPGPLRPLHRGPPRRPHRPRLRHVPARDDCVAIARLALRRRDLRLGRRRRRARLYIDGLRSAT